MTFIANARMYAVTPGAEAAWRALLDHVLADAGCAGDFAYLSYPAPQPLEDLWTRQDLGCVLMCGYPIALGLAAVTPLAAPIPAAEWAGHRAVYRSDLIVRADAPYRTLEDTFGGTAGWTVAHSHSGFNAFRHHLLSYRSITRPRLYATMKPGLVTARRILDEVREGTLDIGPLDAYWHMLIAKHAPDVVAGIRVLTSTQTAPMPAFVAGPDVPTQIVTRLRESFAQAFAAPWFPALGEALCLRASRPSITAVSLRPCAGMRTRAPPAIPCRPERWPAVGGVAYCVS